MVLVVLSTKDGWMWIIGLVVAFLLSVSSTLNLSQAKDTTHRFYSIILFDLDGVDWCCIRLVLPTRPYDVFRHKYQVPFCRHIIFLPLVCSCRVLDCCVVGIALDLVVSGWLPLIIKSINLIKHIALVLHHFVTGFYFCMLDFVAAFALTSWVCNAMQCW